MSFGDNLRAARERRGLTQQQVADIMEIDKSTYCGYETGKRQPDVPKIKKLSNILGVSGDELLGTGYAVEPTHVPTSGHSAIALKFAEEFNDLTDDEWEKVHEYALFLKSQNKTKDQK